MPAGGTIDWVTYYLRDRALAHALVAARARGVRVRLTLEGWPRAHHANERVRAILAPALGADLRVSRSRLDRFGWAKRWRPRVHEKLYCFSHPEPVALVGSFNPSGDVPEEDPAVVAAVGDQDRGHNVLVELREAVLARALMDHARRIHGALHAKPERWLRRQNETLAGSHCRITFRPRAAPDPVLALVAAAGRGARLRLAASHLSGGIAPALLAAAASRGAEVEVIAEATARRVPAAVEASLVAAGVRVHRLRETGVPMHLKFLLLEGAGPVRVAFGSFNWTDNSLRHNREIIAVSEEVELVAAFAQCFERLRPRALASHVSRQ